MLPRLCAAPEVEMRKARLFRFEQLLTELREELVTGKRAPAPSRAGEPASRDEDAAPLEEMLQSITSNRNRTAGATLALVDKALAKLHGGADEFGLCEECGEEIAPGRLEAVPHAEYCVACQSRADEPKGPPTRRKITDYR